MWEVVGDRTERQHIDPLTLIAISVSFPFYWAVQPGAWGPASLGAGFLYRILSPTRLISKNSVGGLGAPSAGCWLSLPHLVTNGSGLQTNWLPVFTKLYNSSTSTFHLWTSQSHSFNPSTVKVIFWYSLTARSDCRSIYKNVSGECNLALIEKFDCLKPLYLATGLCTKPHKQKNLVLAVRKLMRPHYHLI